VHFSCQQLLVDGDLSVSDVEFVIWNKRPFIQNLMNGLLLILFMYLTKVLAKGQSENQIFFAQIRPVILELKDLAALRSDIQLPDDVLNNICCLREAFPRSGFKFYLPFRLPRYASRLHWSHSEGRSINGIKKMARCSTYFESQI